MHINDSITDKINKANGKLLVSLEYIPSKVGESISKIHSSLDEFKLLEPDFVSITSHAYIRNLGAAARGHVADKVKETRHDNTPLSVGIKNRYNLDIVPHLICAGNNKYDNERTLLELNYHEIRSVLALRGDPAVGKTFTPEPEGHSHAVDLVRQIADMNKGKYLNDDVLRNPTNFCIGVAAYPEKHIESQSKHIDMLFLEEKIDAGASFIITQMCFDNNKFIEFRELMDKYGINVPVIMGVKIIHKTEQLYSIPKIFGVDIPKELVNEFSNYTEPEALKDVGVNYAAKQVAELKKYIAGAHIFTMSNINPALELMKGLRKTYSPITTSVLDKYS